MSTVDSIISAMISNDKMAKAAITPSDCGHTLLTVKLFAGTIAIVFAHRLESLAEIVLLLLALVTSHLSTAIMPKLIFTPVWIEIITVVSFASIFMMSLPTVS